jgi:hypothetical protein
MPRGDDILFQSRRAVVGHGLTHATALRLRVPCSDLEVYVPRSVNAFRTYGALGFFHGGATLQELVIPVVIAVWSGKRKKTPVSLRKLEFITSLQPRLELVSGVQSGLFATGRCCHEASSSAWSLRTSSSSTTTSPPWSTRNQASPPS